MTKREVLAIIKEANVIVDKLSKVAEGSKEYNDLSEGLYWALECLVGEKWFSLRLSQRTGHYYVKF